MLQAEALETFSDDVIGHRGLNETMQPPAGTRFSEPLFDSTPRAVRMDGRHLARDMHDVVVGQLVEGLKLADAQNKQELLICNIAPWVKLGQDDISRVPETQDMILAALEDACDYLGREMPETRLSLHFGEFDIRCYLGREKPSDHIYVEDWISDSR